MGAEKLEAPPADGDRRRFGRTATALCGAARRTRRPLNVMPRCRRTRGCNAVSGKHQQAARAAKRSADSIGINAVAVVVNSGLCSRRVVKLVAAQRIVVSRLSMRCGSAWNIGGGLLVQWLARRLDKKVATSERAPPAGDTPTWRSLLGAGCGVARRGGRGGRRSSANGARAAAGARAAPRRRVSAGEGPLAAAEAAFCARWLAAKSAAAERRPTVAPLCVWRRLGRSISLGFGAIRRALRA